MRSPAKRAAPGSPGLADEPLRVVAMGGGTGLSTLLSGLKRYARGAHGEAAEGPHTLDVTAVVTVSDDGGSSGRLRRDFDVLPPGDIRNCMVALSEDETLLSQLFQYRFRSGRGLKGHSFGNLFLTAMNEITGDFPHAVRLSSEILAVRGRIFPATAAKVTLEALLSGGGTLCGESRIGKGRLPIERIMLRPARCRPLPEVMDAIRSADVITLGPGSLYTSVIPNLLVAGIATAVEQSQALKIYFVNLMWQPGETINFSASRHVDALLKHAHGRKIIDYVVLNTAPIPARLRRKYAAQKVKPVENDVARLEEMGMKMVAADLLGESKLVRHDAQASARIIVDLAVQARRARKRAKVANSPIRVIS